MTLQQLRYVNMIAECGSLSQAARKLYIAQPSLSIALSELEKEIDKELFFRTARGIKLTDEGIEFLAFARQVLQQMDTLEERYDKGRINKHFFSVSSQHYNFASEAFTKVAESVGSDRYEFMYLERQTSEIIEDIRTMRSEIGLLYLSDMNSSVIRRLLKENHLIFEPLFSAKPCACIRNTHPLAYRNSLTMEELKPYPFLTYNQSKSNTYSMSEIILDTDLIDQHLIVSDRSSASSLMTDIDAYCITAGSYVSRNDASLWTYIPITGQGKVTVGIVRNDKMIISSLGIKFVEALQDIISQWELE